MAPGLPVRAVREARLDLVVQTAQLESRANQVVQV